MALPFLGERWLGVGPIPPGCHVTPYVCCMSDNFYYDNLLMPTYIALSHDTLLLR